MMTPSLKRSWYTYRHLSWGQRRLLLSAWVLLLLVAPGLRLLGFRRAQAALLWATPTPRRRDLSLAQTTAQLVQSAARWNPLPATCLSRSLVLIWLLRRQGLVAELRIGVAQADGQMMAHAWVEHDGVALNDSQDVAGRYAPFDHVWLLEENGAL